MIYGKKLKESDVAALTMLVEFSDKMRSGPFRATEAERDQLAAVYWSTFDPSYVASTWAGFSPATLRSLVNRRLAEFKPGYERSYWTRVTEFGRVALEEHRERTGYYVDGHPR